MSWPSTKIGDVATVLPGFAFKSKDLADEGLPVVKIGNISDDGTVDVEQTQKLPVSLFEKRHQKYKINKGDILIAMTGATAGKVGRIKAYSEGGYLLNQRVAQFIPHNMDQDFFWFVVGTDAYRRKFYSLGGGAAQPNMSGPQIASVEIPNPPIDIQNRIASALSAYDDLIENNRRRIALLEEAARLLYREWFVHCRFPGHEHVKTIDGIPENFDVLELGNVCKLRGGNAFKTKFQGKLSGDYPFIKVGDMNSVGNSVSITEANNWVSEMEIKAMKAKPFPPGTIVFAKIGEALKQNRVRLISRNTLIDNNMMGAIPDEESISPGFLYFLLRDYDIASHASGAAVPFLTATVLSKLKFPIPNKTLRTEFERIVAPILKQIANLQVQITTTAKARDLLLPRLMDGRLEV